MWNSESVQQGFTTLLFDFYCFSRLLIILFSGPWVLFWSIGTEKLEERILQRGPAWPLLEYDFWFQLGAMHSAITKLSCNISRLFNVYAYMYII